MLSRAWTMIALVLVVVLLLSAANQMMKTGETRTLKKANEIIVVIQNTTTTNRTTVQDKQATDRATLLADARIACAKIAMHRPNNFQMCVDDVRLTQDLGLASVWDQADEATLSPDDKRLRYARIACATLMDHFDACVDAYELPSVEHGIELSTNDATGVAEDDDDKEEDNEPPMDKETLLREARIACAKIQMTQENDFEMCVSDVVLTKELGLAGMWAEAVESTLNTKDKLLRHARIACAQASNVNFEPCVQALVAQGNLSDNVKRLLRGIAPMKDH